MIFTCPSCSAGHSVPVSMIPSGGMEMTCRRCAVGFHVDMPERTQAGPITLPPDDGELDGPINGESDAEATPELTNPEPTSVGMIDPPLPQNVEPTRIGVVTPFVEPEEPKPESLLSPSGQIYAPTARFEQPRTIDTKPDIPQDLKPDPKRAPRASTPVTHGRTIPPTAAEMGLDPELDDTIRFESDAGSANPQKVSLLDPPTNLRRDAKTHVGDLAQGSGPSERVADKVFRVERGRSGKVDRNEPRNEPRSEPRGEIRGETSEPSGHSELSIGSGPNGLYERVAAGVYTPEEPKAGPPSSSRVRAKSWDEPSAYLAPNSAIARVVEPLRKAAVVLNHAPLAFKVALVVFPLTLGIALMFTTTHETGPKEAVEIAIPTTDVETEAIAAEDTNDTNETNDTNDTNAANDARETKSAEKKAAKQRPPPRKVVMPGDDAAPEGHAYVQMDHARLRAEPGEDRAQIGRLELGQLVRTYDKVDTFVLVMAQPKGPAGFISEKLIGAKKPIAVLAKEIAFAACEVTAEYTIDDCLYQGKQQHDACIEACGVAVGGGEDSPTLRCAEACKVAFTECQRSCNGEGDPKKKRPTVPARATRTAPRAQTRPR